MLRAASSLAAALAVAASLSLIPAAAHSASRQEVFEVLDRLPSNWADAGLEAWLNDDPQDPTVVVGEPVTYGYRARTGGFVSIVHVDSHGTTSLIFPRESGYAEGPVSDVYPRSGALEQSAPLGKETVYVVLTEEALDPTAFGAAPGQDFVRGDDSLDLVQRYAKAVAGLAESSRVARARFQYFVEGKPGTTEYTTRGIKRVLLGDLQAAAAGGRSGPSAVPERNWPDRIAFAFNSDELTRQGRLQLDVWGEVLADERINHSVILIGHTDDVGSDDYNLELSKRRAEAARDYIVRSFGIDPSRLEVQWRGESDPLVPNVDDEARAKNRRVEFVFVRK